jgi:hypothetical protein
LTQFTVSLLLANKTSHKPWLDLPSAGEEKLMPKLGELTKLATKPDEVYSGNRVYDEM